MSYVCREMKWRKYAYLSFELSSYELFSKKDLMLIHFDIEMSLFLCIKNLASSCKNNNPFTGTKEGCSAPS